jgi:hypothetical protein
MSAPASPTEICNRDRSTRERPLFIVTGARTFLLQGKPVSGAVSRGGGAGTDLEVAHVWVEVGARRQARGLGQVCRARWRRAAINDSLRRGSAYRMQRDRNERHPRAAPARAAARASTQPLLPLPPPVRRSTRGGAPRIIRRHQQLSSCWQLAVARLPSCEQPAVA